MSNRCVKKFSCCANVHCLQKAFPVITAETAEQFPFIIAGILQNIFLLSGKVCFAQLFPMRRTRFQNHSVLRDSQDLKPAGGIELLQTVHISKGFLPGHVMPYCLEHSVKESA